LGHIYTGGPAKTCYGYSALLTEISSELKIRPYDSKCAQREISGLNQRLCIPWKKTVHRD